MTAASERQEDKTVSQRPPGSVLAVAQDIVRREAAGVLAVAEQLDESFEVVVQLLLDTSGKVFVTGSGTSGAVARRMAHLLAVCGTPAMYINAMDALHGTMGAVVEGDVVIAISKGGGSAEINELAHRVRDRGAVVVALTAAPRSQLATAADHVAVVTSPDGVDPGEVIAMGSTLSTAVWGDALAYVLMRARGYGWAEVLQTHPAGAVGSVVDVPEPLEPLDDGVRARARAAGAHEKGAG